MSSSSFFNRERERERENVDDVTLERQKLTEETLILGTLLDRLKFAASHPLLGFYWPGRLHVSLLLSSTSSFHLQQGSSRVGLDERSTSGLHKTSFLYS
jgi:hypothetical protein